jgi:hypothetical protein
MANQIMVIKIGYRRDNAAKVQHVLSQYGCSIKVRLGLHEAGDVCSDEGLVILQLVGDKEELIKMQKALNEVDNVKAKMVDLDD